MTFPNAQLNALSNDRLHLMILPTEQCNFRCTYCYEEFVNQKMRQPVVEGVKALIARRAPQLAKLRLGWFGGEPMVAFDVVTEISRAAIETARRHDIMYDADVTTNAFHLDAERLDACLDLGIRSYHIALDGDRAMHDRTRRLASGAGSFDRIWANLLTMKDNPRDLAGLLRLHYTAANWRAIGEFAARVQDVFGADPRFAPYFHSIEQFGGPNDKDIIQLGNAEKLEIEAALYARSGIERESPADATPICYAACGNSLIVRSTGRLAKCTIALQSDHNDIGTLLPDGSIEVDQTKFQRWVAPVIEGRWDDMACPLPSVIREVLEEREQALA